MKTKFSQKKELYIKGRTEICCLAFFEDSTIWLCKDADTNAPKYVRVATKADIEFFKVNPFPTTAREVAANEKRR